MCVCVFVCVGNGADGMSAGVTTRAPTIVYETIPFSAIKSLTDAAWFSVMYLWYAALSMSAFL